MNEVKPWLDTVGKFIVEHIPCPHFSEAVNLAAPRTGVIHTTEGSTADGALGVFKTHFAPQFLVAPGRIIQMVQVGTIGAALVHHNPDTIVQVEVVGFSKQQLWFPDDATAEALAALMATCQTEYGIPLTHPWADGDFGAAGDNPHRHAGKWGVIAGWYGHGDVPSLPAPAAPESHWDPGALQWSKLFDLARGMIDILHAPGWKPAVEPPRPCAGHVDSSTPQKADVTPAVPSDPLMRRKFIQAFLNAHASAGLAVDGQLGPSSEAAIAGFLSKHSAG